MKRILISSVGARTSSCPLRHTQKLRETLLIERFAQFLCVIADFIFRYYQNLSARKFPSEKLCS